MLGTGLKITVEHRTLSDVEINTHGVILCFWPIGKTCFLSYVRPRKNVYFKPCGYIVGYKMR